MNRSECYRILGLQPGASNDELKAAYRRLAKTWHPDKFTGRKREQQRATERMKEINIAYETLQSGNSQTESSDEPRTQSPPRYRSAPRRPTATAPQPPQEPVYAAPPRTPYVGFCEGVGIILQVLNTMWGSNRSQR